MCVYGGLIHLQKCVVGAFYPLVAGWALLYFIIDGVFQLYKGHSINKGNLKEINKNRVFFVSFFYIWHWLFSEAVSKGHANSLLGIERTHQYWFPWWKSNCKQYFLLLTLQTKFTLFIVWRLYIYIYIYIYIYNVESMWVVIIDLMRQLQILFEAVFQLCPWERSIF